MITARIENNALFYDGSPEVDEKYPGYCCAGHDFIIAIVWPAVYDWDMVSGWGCCLNPDCPNTDGLPDDPYRGVKSWDIEGFALTLAEMAETPSLR